MLNIVNQIVPKAYAQFGGGNGAAATNSFSLSSFNFLNPLVTNNNQTTATAFSTYFSATIGWFLTIIAIAAFIYLLIAGFSYITAGGDDAKVEKGRKGIVNALIGILIILVAYIVLRYVATSIIPTP